MEASPSDLDLYALKKTLNEIVNVKEIHDLHVWSISGEKKLATIHFVAEREPLKT